MRILVVIDPLENLKPETDSTIEIMAECAKEGIEQHICETKDLYFRKDRVYSRASQVSMEGKDIKPERPAERELDFFDLILMRKEPPYDLNYHYATMLLEKTKARVINNPQGLRNANEKLVILNFPSVIPPTLVTKEERCILDFVEEHGKAVIKPIHLFGGKDVYLLGKDSDDLHQNIQKIIKDETDYALVQQFKPEVMQGDRRIFLLDGEPLGAIIRRPKQGDFRANMAVGGTPEKTELTESDNKIIETIKPYLRKEGLALAGIDIIGDMLIEINVTCPTGLVPIRQFAEENTTRKIVDHLKGQAKK